jgi:two-component system phosphate regulon sensor histidine kinase PhoR
MRRSRHVTAEFSRLTDALPLGVVVAAPDNRVALTNARAREFWPTLGTGRALPDDLARLASPAGATTSSILASPSGGRVAVRVHALPARHRRDRDHELLLTLHDATHMQQEAEFATALVRQISHELKTPLSVIRGHASRFADDSDADPTETRRAWGVVDDEATRLTALIDQAILMARLEIPEPMFQRRPLNLRAICEEVVIDLADSVARRGVELDLEAEEADYTLGGDRPALRQMLLNLVDNAVKYGGDGVRIVISLGMQRETGQIRLAVRDDGPGIADADLSLIFEKGYRGPHARGSRAGSGLGLALVRSIVAWHGGVVSAESEPGRGTSIVILLPVPKNEEVGRS